MILVVLCGAVGFLLGGPVGCAFGVAIMAMIEVVVLFTD